MKNFRRRKLFELRTQRTSQLNQFDLLQRRRQKPGKSLAPILSLIALGLASLNVIGDVQKASSKPVLDRPSLPTPQDMRISGMDPTPQPKPANSSQRVKEPFMRQPIYSSRAH